MVNQLFVLEAEKLLINGKTDEAIALCNSGLEQYPDYTAAYILLAKAYQKQGELGQALTIISEANEKFPDNKSVNQLKSMLSNIIKVRSTIIGTIQESYEQRQDIAAKVDETQQKEDIIETDVETKDIQKPSESKDIVFIDNIIEEEDTEKLITEDNSKLVSIDSGDEYIPDLEAMFTKPKNEDDVQESDTIEEFDEFDEFDETEVVSEKTESEEDKVPDLEALFAPPKIEDDVQVTGSVVDFESADSIINEEDELTYSDIEEATEDSLEYEEINESIMSMNDSEVQEQSEDNIHDYHGFAKALEQCNIYENAAKKIISGKLDLIPGLSFTILKQPNKETTKQLNTLNCIPDFSAIKNSERFLDFNSQKKKQLKFTDNISDVDDFSIDTDEHEELNEKEHKPAMITETIANIYFMQKAYNQAANAYKILARENPEKKEYFYEKIREIESIQT